MKKLIKSLKKLKEIGVVGVKQSFEDEGASFKDIETMRLITSAAKIHLNIKIGGCEAKNDIFFCKKIKANTIVAPMVESVYALSKFVQCANIGNKISLLVNLETNLSLKNLNKMIKSKFFDLLDGVVIGRSDLAGSLYLSKGDVDSKKIFNKVEIAFKKIKNSNKKNFIFKMGGSITPRSKIFINKLYLKKLLHRVETRNVEIKLSKKTIKNIDKIVIEIFKFELDWLKYKLKNIKKENNELLFDDYSSRIIEMTERLKKHLNV
jgi:4-hydroxy-2-oxoheptanedioate aldolase